MHSHLKTKSQNRISRICSCTLIQNNKIEFYAFIHTFLHAFSFKNKWKIGLHAFLHAFSFKQEVKNGVSCIHPCTLIHHNIITRIMTGRSKFYFKNIYVEIWSYHHSLLGKIIEKPKLRCLQTRFKIQESITCGEGINILQCPS